MEQLLQQVDDLVEAALAPYSIKYVDGKRIRVRKKVDTELVDTEPAKDIKDDVSLIKARLYAVTPKAQAKKDRSMLARGYRDTAYL